MGVSRCEGRFVTPQLRTQLTAAAETEPAGHSPGQALPSALPSLSGQRDSEAQGQGLKVVTTPEPSGPVQPDSHTGSQSPTRPNSISLKSNYNRGTRLCC